MRVKLLQLATPMKPPFTGGILFFCKNCKNLIWTFLEIIFVIFIGQGWSPSRKTPMTLHGSWSLFWTICLLALIIITRSTVDLDFVDFGDAEEKSIGEVSWIPFLAVIPDPTSIWLWTLCALILKIQGNFVLSGVEPENRFPEAQVSSCRVHSRWC